MTVNTAYLNAVADSGNPITHIGLVDELNAEITGGSYARLPVTWTAASSGLIRPSADLTFDIPAGNTIAGWRGYSALTAGTEYGGEDLVNETFAGGGSGGQYTLLAASTGIQHSAAP